MKTRVLVILFISLFSNSTMASSNGGLRKSQISQGLRVIQKAEKKLKVGNSQFEAIGYLDDNTGMYKLNPNFKQTDLADFGKNRWLNVFENPHDDREYITERAFPYSTIGKISFKKGSDIFTCSGTLVGPRHVATAAHCIQDRVDSSKLLTKF
ncbi:MAG: serine protease [Oligoflexales bacterium]